jgi:peptidoglycan/LPS O-acetylase OafA/YrhL
MTKASTSRLYALECVRGIAGFYVFVHHIAHYSLAEAYPWLARPFLFGQLAVMTFFVMSGFVIAYSTNESMTFREYFVRRVRRIYPLYLVAMLLMYVSQCVSRHTLIVPEARPLVVNLLMLQDGGEKPGVWSGPFMGNAPLWSLSYEWFFYMAYFPIASFLRDRPNMQKYLVAALSVVGFFTFLVVPNPISVFLTYFVLWWSGVELAREYMAKGIVSFRGQVGSLLAVVAITLLWAGRVALVRQSVAISPWAHPMLELRHFLTTLGILVGGLVWFHLGGVGFRPLLGWGRRLEPISYAIYVCHVPVLTVSASLRLTPNPLYDILWVVPVAVGIAWLLERKLQPWINGATARSLPARPRPMPSGNVDLAIAPSSSSPS